ncbi:MAG TPA: phage holin family protein [Cellulomonas sp.]|nr:phage holin family protein [Cellulomonas sp.]
MVTGTHGPTANDHQSIGELIGRLSEQGARLVHAEIELAKAEMAAHAQAAGIGLGLFAGAAMFGFFAVATLIATAIMGLANAVAPWLAGLIVSLALLILTATLALVGRNRLQAGTRTPDRTVENVKKDVDAVKEGLS